jgi:hypothetical protein
MWTLDGKRELMRSNDHPIGQIDVGSTDASNGRLARVGQHADESAEMRESITQGTKVRGSMCQSASVV